MASVLGRAGLFIVPEGGAVTSRETLREKLKEEMAGGGGIAACA